MINHPPDRVLGCYWPYWNGPALSSLPALYNTIYLFSARPVGGAPGSTGAVIWSQERENTAKFNSDLAALRAAGRCVILSVGGEGEYIRLDTKTRADAFIASIKNIHTQLGGFDGVDFDIEGGTVWAAQLIYIAQQLKALYGTSFAITYPPGPWDPAARSICQEMYKAGVLDLVAPQYYDISGLGNETSKISGAVDSIKDDWLPLVNGDASKVGLGYGISSAVTETMSLTSFVSVWETLAAAHPTLRGVFCWEAAADASEAYSFATTLAPVLNRGGTLKGSLASPVVARAGENSHMV